MNNRMAVEAGGDDDDDGGGDVDGVAEGYVCDRPCDNDHASRELGWTWVGYAAPGD